MYLRFTVPVEHGGHVTRARLAPGPFRSAYRLGSAAGDTTDCPLRHALRREHDWFNANLPIPDRVTVRARGRWWADGVCWFRDDAAEMLRHMHVLAALLWDFGIPVDRHVTRDPGQLLYKDSWQVVAKPDFTWRTGRIGQTAHPH